jgi:hypothetical protein
MEHRPQWYQNKKYPQISIPHQYQKLWFPHIIYSSGIKEIWYQSNNHAEGVLSNCPIQEWALAEVPHLSQVVSTTHNSAVALEICTPRLSLVLPGYTDCGWLSVWLWYLWIPNNRMTYHCWCLSHRKFKIKCVIDNLFVVEMQDSIVNTYIVKVKTC